MAATVLVPGPALRPLLQLVERPDGAAGEGLEADGDDGEGHSDRLPLTRSLTVCFPACIVYRRTHTHTHTFLRLTFRPKVISMLIRRLFFNGKMFSP